MKWAEARNVGEKVAAIVKAVMTVVTLCDRNVTNCHDVTANPPLGVEVI